MKKIITCLVTAFVLTACSNSSEEKNTIVDTSIVGSDNPRPSIDTAKTGNTDSLKNKLP